MMGGFFATSEALELSDEAPHRCESPTKNNIHILKLKLATIGFKDRLPEFHFPKRNKNPNWSQIRYTLFLIHNKLKSKYDEVSVHNKL